LFVSAFLIRLVYVLFIYFFNLEHYGHYYESNEGDITWYVPSALQMVEQLKEGRFMDVVHMWMGWNVDISDLGYIIYLSILYLLTGGFSEVVFPLILKAIYGAVTCLMMYRVAKRHFGEHVGRMTGIFCMLQANMIWWCGSMMKETEMIFFLSLYVNEMDRVLSLEKFELKDLTGAILLGFVLFAFRSVLALVAFGAMFVSVLLTKTQIISIGKKIFLGSIVVLVLALSYGDNILVMANDLKDTAFSGTEQQANMEWRTKRANGNKFAKYAGAAVFAPLIFTIPFPNMVYTFQGQEMHMMMNGGNFEKNILSFFVIMVMFSFLLTGEWRKHTFIIAMLIAYLLALVFSNFAQSGRFHMPIIPLELMYAAYGISALYKTKVMKRWFNYALVLEFIACIAWGWFKLAGRGMI
jgi:hypothetical protein